MFDWLGSGIFGGLFGPMIVQFLRRFKLSTIFITGAIGSQSIVFLMGVRIGGWQFAWHRMLEKAFTPVGICLPIGVGALCVLVIVICAPDLIGKASAESSEKQKSKSEKDM